MDNGAVLMIGVVLLLLGAVGLLLGVQVWLAGKGRLLWGLLQPAVWVACALAGNLLPRLQGTAVQGGLQSAGAVVMAVLSLAVFLLARRKFN